MKLKRKKIKKAYSWYESLEVNGKFFNKIDIFVEHNDFNYITNINFKFYSKDIPGVFYLGKIAVTNFNTEAQLVNLIKKQIKKADSELLEAINRSNQYELFN